MVKQEQKKSKVQIKGLASERGVYGSSVLTGGKEEYTGIDAGWFMAVGRCGSLLTTSIFSVNRSQVIAERKDSRRGVGS